MRKMVYAFFVLLSSFAMYRYRYRVLNAVLRIQPLQRWIVQIGMNVPVIRKLIVSQVVHEV
ncbi:hypothetical protein [Anoxybacteroides amylolyticum]|uniref:Uncharacterized protein n=1 Tax=Anoxybacteroides amylolyticum TaxID=294699 RepID=A0A160F5H1_9BACL|nr:hypothetical protein [Anoxybacillus amylolyticus]ANB61738.1 hypothetical protein GFC30_2642 [Anoxybacillus amylolyticus]